jgi:plastocyanin
VKTLIQFVALLLISNSLQSAQIKVRVENSDGGMLSNIAVVITPKQLNANSKAQTETVFQKDMAFSPYLSVVQAGQPVQFTNNDDITHHVFSASRDQNFAFKLRKGQSNNSIEFLQPAEISMGCNIHDWMSGHLLVVDTPHFSLTDEQGLSSIDIEEIGEASLRIWHPQMSEKEKKKRVSIVLDGNDLLLELKLEDELGEIPEQSIDDDLDFLDDY